MVLKLFGLLAGMALKRRARPDTRAKHKHTHEALGKWGPRPSPIELPPLLRTNNFPGALRFHYQHAARIRTKTRNDRKPRKVIARRCGWRARRLYGTFCEPAGIRRLRRATSWRSRAVIWKKNRDPGLTCYRLGILTSPMFLSLMVFLDNKFSAKHGLDI